MNNAPTQAEMLARTGGQDSFSPMGLNQEQLKALVFSNMGRLVGRKNWTDDILKSLRVRGQAQFYTRYIWKNLPNGLDSQQMERMLYYRGMVGIFYSAKWGFIILPVMQVSKKGSNAPSINFMGRWKWARPVPFNGSGEDKKDKDDTSQNKELRLVLAEVGEKDVLWEVPFFEGEEAMKEALEMKCVMCYDYTPQISEIPLARANLEIPFYEGQVELIKMIRTASLNSTGVQWVRVNNEAEAKVLQDQFRVYDSMILNGQRYICISNTTEIQEASSKPVIQMQEFWASWQSLENLRQSCIGLGNDGMQQKSQYQNQMEMQLDNIGNNPVLLDGWLQRVKFCMIANAMWGLNIGVEVAGMDTNGISTQNEQENNEEADDNE